MVFLGFLLSIFVPLLFSKLEDYKKVEGIFSHAELIIYQEWQYKNKYIGHKLVDVPRLTLFLIDHNITYTLGKQDYESFFGAIENKNNFGKSIKIYLRKTENEEMNPMQIEIDNEVVLPLSYHKRINKYLTVGATLLFLIAILGLFKYIRKYKNQYYDSDKALWQEGIRKKLSVAGKWIGL